MATVRITLTDTDELQCAVRMNISVDPFSAEEREECRATVAMLIASYFSRLFHEQRIDLVLEKGLLERELQLAAGVQAELDTIVKAAARKPA